MRDNNITISNTNKIRKILSNLYREFGLEAKCEKNCVLYCLDNTTSYRKSTIRNELVGEYDTLVSVTVYFDIIDNERGLSLLIDDKTYDNIMDSTGYIQLNTIINFEEINGAIDIEIRNLSNNKSYTVTLLDIIDMLNDYKETAKVLKRLGIKKCVNEYYFEADENTKEDEALENIKRALYNIDTASLIFIYLKLMLEKGNKHEEE